MMGGGGGGPAAPPAPGPGSEAGTVMCINALIDKGKTECLNEDSSYPLQNAFNSSDAMVLRSDCDEQLMINIYFTENVKIHHLIVKQNSDDTAPKAVCLYINRAPMDFDDPSNIEAD